MAAASQGRRATDTAPVGELLRSLAERFGESKNVSRRDRRAYRLLSVLLSKPECSIESLIVNAERVENLAKAAYRLTDAMARAGGERA